MEKLAVKRDIEGLTKALLNKTTSVRLKAAQALGEIKEASAVEPLLRIMKDYWNGIRRKVAEAPGAVEFVAQAMVDKDVDLGIPIEVEEALVKIGEPAVESLDSALKDQNVGVHEAAQRALGKIKAKKSQK